METQRKTLVRLLALALGIAGASEALAVTRYFDCVSGNMQTASCWSSNIRPVAGDNAYVGYSSYLTAVTATLNSGSFAATNEYVGNGITPAHTLYAGTVNHSAAANTVSNALYVGYHQTGDFGGSIYYGVYNLSGTASLTTFRTEVGYNTYGTINQTGGTHTISTDLSLGRFSDALGAGSGIYKISGGTLNVNNSITTGAGYGTLKISGGTVNVGGSIVEGTGGSVYLSGAGILNVGGGNGSIDVAFFSLGDSGTHTLSGSGSINTTYSNIKGLIGGAATFTQTGGSHTSFDSIVGGFSGAGTYLQSGGSFTGTQAIVGYDGTGSYNLSGGTQALSTLKIGTNSGGNGSYMLSGTAVLTTTQTTVGEIEGTGSFTQSGGTHTVSQLYLGDDTGAAVYGGNGTYNLQGGMLNAGTIDMLRGGTAAFNFTGGTLAVGTFIGNLVNNGGILAPGASPGTTVVQGNYTQGAAGALNIELGGTGTGLFDVLQVTGTATLGGKLKVLFWNGYSATAGDRFDIVSATNLSGGFDTLNLATLGTGLVWNVDYLYDQDLVGTDYVRLSVQAVPETKTYAMMLAGLGLVGWAARRKQTC